MAEKGQGQRLRILRDWTGLEQVDFAREVLKRRRGGTVSNLENQDEVWPGYLLMASRICANSEEVFRWLQDDGKQPSFYSILPGVKPEDGWQGLRRDVATRLRALADEFDPPTEAVAADQAARDAAASEPHPQAGKEREQA